MKKRGRKPENYLIDASWNGNSLRLYFGGAVEKIRGDDWNDTPYDVNSGQVYSEFVNCVIDALIPFNYRITDHAGELDYRINSALCRNDFKSGEIPLFWITDYTADHRDDIIFRIGDMEKVVVDRLKTMNAMWRTMKK